MFPDTTINMLMHGHDLEYKLIKPSKELILTSKKIDELKGKTIRLQRVELEAAIKESEEFLNEHFNLHKIYHATNEEINAELSKYDFKNIYHANRVYKKTIKKIAPFQLPIELTQNEDYSYGEIEEISPNCSQLKLYKIAPIAFEKISLGEISTSRTGCVITHEMTHGQIDTHKKITKSYYNHEVLPMFLQLVHSLEKDEDQVHLEIELLFRTLEISQSITELNDYYQKSKAEITDSLLNITKYLESALKALYLFDIYINSNSRVQNTIFNKIQAIFDGKKTVESLLDKYNITLERSSKQLQRKFNRS